MRLSRLASPKPNTANHRERQSKTIDLAGANGRRRAIAFPGRSPLANVMSSSDASLNADASFSAEPTDHMAQPTAPTPAERRGLALALIAAAILHLLIPLAIVAYYLLWPPAVAPAEKEIPVEIVVEPPKQEKAEDRPKPPPAPDDERPAYDAPSAETQEKANRESPDPKTQAPAREAALPQQPGAPQQSETPPAAPEPKTQASPPPEEARPVPNADQPAAPTPTPAEADATPPAPMVQPKPAPPPAPKPPPSAPAGAPLPTDDVLPQYKLAHAATESRVIGGNADTRYFTIVYGMIRSHLRAPSGPSAAPASRSGAIVFTVDETGNLLERKVMSSSGSPTLDMALMAAIAEAAPYPAPPGWQPRSMRLTYGR
jgi:periplasmic protein TonB